MPNCPAVTCSTDCPPVSVQYGAVMSDSVFSRIPATRHLPRNVADYTETFTEEQCQATIKAAKDAGNEPECRTCL